MVKRGRAVGKDFHSEETSFRRSFRGIVIEKWPGELQTHQVVVLAMLHAQHLGPHVSHDGWQLGQCRQGSARDLKRYLAAEGMERRTATSIPPAETLMAVANSRNSLSDSIWLLTKTGIAKGKRGHRLRSSDGVLPFTRTLSPISLTGQFKHLRGQSLIRGLAPGRMPTKP